MSRLDSNIRRLQAQRECLNLAASLVAERDGVVLDLGLGNGRTYDHLRELFPKRDIYVCERQVAAHPDCIPPDNRLLLGDMRETLPQAAASLRERAVLAHLDAASHNVAASRILADQLLPLILPLLCSGGLLISDPSFDHTELEALPLPDAVEPGRYHIYRRISR